MNARRKIIVSHVGRRDNYDVAFCLSENGFEVFLISDFYFISESIMGRVAKFLFGSEVNRRYREGLRVKYKTSFLLLILDIAERIFPRKKMINYCRSFELGRLAVKVIRNENIECGVFYYNSGIYKASSNYPNFRAILFQMHPDALYLRELYQNYMDSNPIIAKELSAEEEEATTSESYLTILMSEPSRAEKIICTSTFVRTGLIRRGVPSEKIILIPYASRKIVCSERITAPLEISSNYELHLCFVGQFVVRKGIYELIQCIIRQPHVHLTIFTRDRNFCLDRINKWFGDLPANIDVVEELSDANMWSNASECDFLILPSIAEGFGLVILEAMQLGLPVIASEFTVGPDVIQHGFDGYLIKDNIELTIESVLLDKSSWCLMRNQAREKARKYSLESFSIALINVVKEQFDIDK